MNSWAWNTTTIAPPTANIKGPKGEEGPTGPNGKTPVLSANNYNLYWKYSDATSDWTDLGNFRGEPGETGGKGADGADACPISAKTTTNGKTHNVKIFYTSAANPDTNPLADFNVLDGQDGQGSSVAFDNTTMSGTGQSDDPYGVNTDILATKNWVSEQQYIANITKDTTYLSGDGTSNSPLGIQNTYTEHWNDAYNVTEEYKTASARYDAHSALSATKLDKSIWDNNSGKFVTSAGLNQNTQYAMTTNGWAEIQGGSSFSGAETNNWISGDGTSNKPIGLSAEAASAIEAMTDQYQIDGGQYVSVVPNSTTHKVVVGLDNQAANAIADVIASANVWDEASAVSAKSHTTIDNTTNVIKTENQGTSASLSAVEYKDNVNVAGMNVQQIYAVRNDSDIYACLSTTANKGTLFFVCSGV